MAKLILFFLAASILCHVVKSAEELDDELESRIMSVQDSLQEWRSKVVDEVKKTQQQLQTVFKLENFQKGIENVKKKVGDTLVHLFGSNTTKGALVEGIEIIKHKAEDTIHDIIYSKPVNKTQQVLRSLKKKFEQVKHSVEDTISGLLSDEKPTVAPLQTAKNGSPKSTPKPTKA